MPDYTTNLNLRKTNMSTDENDLFDFDIDLDGNWDKIDSFAGSKGAVGGLAPLGADSCVAKANLPDDVVYATDLNEKADKDGSNMINQLSKAFKQYLTDFVIENIEPDFSRAISVAYNTAYIAPCTGYLYTQSANSSGRSSMNVPELGISNDLISCGTEWTSGSGHAYGWLLVKKGYTLYSTGNDKRIFVPMKGAVIDA